MADEGSDRDEILANFQATTGADFDECMAFLESSDWDLSKAINGWCEVNAGNEEPYYNHANNSPVVVEAPEDEPVIVGPPPPVVKAKASGGASGVSFPPAPNPFRALVEDSDSDDNIVVDDDTNDKHKKKQQPPANCKGFKKHRLRASYKGQERLIDVNAEDTVGEVKRRLADLYQLNYRIVDLNWGRYALADGDDTVISSLNLPLNYTVNVYTTRKNHKKHSNSESSSSSSASKRWALRISFERDGILLTETMYVPDNTTVGKVKQDAHSLTGISPSRQIWQGWTPDTTDASLVSDCNLNNPHDFHLDQLPSPVKAPVADQSTQQGSSQDSMDMSDADESLETEDFSGTNAPFLDTSENGRPSDNRLPLIPSECDSVQEALQNFMVVFEARYGALRPQFSLSSLPDTVRLAFEGPTGERRPLLIYLHDDKGVGCNVFCTQVLCSEQVSSLINNQFIIWGWDVSLEENKEKMRMMATSVVSDNLLEPIHMIPPTHYPLMLVVGREKGTLVPLDVIQGTSLTDEVMTRLLDGMSRFQELNTAEMREEAARQERQLFRDEQMSAYQESLAADKAKKEQEAKELAEKLAVEQKQMEEERKEEEAKQQLANSLSPEPAADCKEAVTTIRLRLPGGEALSRRFKSSEPVANLITFAASKGYPPQTHRLLTSDRPKRDLTDGDMDVRQSFEALKFPAREQITVDEK